MTPQAFLDALSGPAILIGSNERVLAVNAAASDVLTLGEVGRHYITALRQPTLLDVVEQVFLKGGRASTSYVTNDDQRAVTWHVSVAALEQEGEVRTVLLQFEDVSATEAALKMRRDFVSNVSHELRTPLTAVLGFVETVRGAARDDAAARDRFMGIIEREATRMAQLVDDLLSLSRVEDQENRRPEDPVDLVALIENSLSGVEPLAARQEVSIAFEPQSDEVIVPGDAQQLRQVVTNLVENAIKYGGEGNRVTVSLSQPQPDQALRAEAVRLSVSDQGEGIPAHHIPRLTERFYRLDSHRSRELGGTGLGLAIVKHILSRHRGRLRISSEIGQGSTFTAILPLH